MTEKPEISGNFTRFRFLSWGCGTQSTALGEMAVQGLTDPLDAVFTADTGWERQATYETRDHYAGRWREAGLPVYVLDAGDIQKDGAVEHIHIPFWTSDGGPLQRQCTKEFKLIPIKRAMREFAGYHPTDPPHPKPGEFEVWLGISLDEWTRAVDRKTGAPKRQKPAYQHERWPLLEMKLSRQDCIDWLDEQGLPVPVKSACVCCPYRLASEWIEMRDDAPEEFRAAVAFDEEHRHNPLAERGASTVDALYIYKNGPEALGEADLDADAERERRRYGTQIPLMLCESGYCWT